MLSKSQKVEGVQDSSVFQAGGDIHVGLTYTEVKDLCQTLIAAEVGRLTHEIVCKDYSVVGMESMDYSNSCKSLILTKLWRSTSSSLAIR